ncbi:MAG TPA: hypothetical protein VIF83_08815 [Gemmatimonadaceae bacterium]
MIGPEEPLGLFATLAEKARGMSTGALATLSLFSWVAIGLWSIPDGIPRAVPAPILAVGTFGLWGMLDHVRASYGVGRPRLSAAIEASKTFVATVGTFAILLVMFTLLGKLLGVFIL